MFVDGIQWPGMSCIRLTLEQKWVQMCMQALVLGLCRLNGDNTHHTKKLSLTCVFVCALHMCTQTQIYTILELHVQ